MRLKSFILAVVLMGAVEVPAGAQEGLAEDPSREVLLRVIQDLERRVLELERQLHALSLPGAENEELAELRRRIDLLTRELERRKLGEVAETGTPESRYGLGPAASKVYGVPQGISLGGYGEALLEGFDSTRDDGVGSGKTDQFDFLRGVFYIGYKFSDRILFNSEIEFEHASTGKAGEASLEFAYLDFLIRPGFNLRAGLVLTPVGFINELHEPPVFLGARRPDVDRVILPTTWPENGAGVFGDIGPISYRAYIMNGLRASGFEAPDGIRGGRQKGSKARAEDFALTGRLDWSVRPGLLFGGSFYTGDSGQEETVGSPPVKLPDARVNLWDLHGEWKWRGLEFRGVYSEVEIDDTAEIFAATGEIMGEEMFGWYAQAGYDLLASVDTEQSLIPFLRVEKYNTQDKVAAGFTADPASDVDLLTVGVAYRPILQVMIKADFQNFDNEAGTGTDQFNVAFTYLF